MPALSHNWPVTILAASPDKPTVAAYQPMPLALICVGTRVDCQGFPDRAEYTLEEKATGKVIGIASLDYLLGRTGNSIGIGKRILRKKDMPFLVSKDGFCH